MSSPLVIAIDGFSSCGKSTLAKDIAEQLNILYIDSGAMYRAVTLYLIENTIDYENEELLIGSLPDIKIHFRKFGKKYHTFLNDKDVESRIRHQDISDHVSEVAALSPDRRKLVELQRKMAAGTSLVMDGRDIGTVVFPKATVKLFLTADVNVRALRRLQELRDRGLKISKQEVLDNLKKRDTIDSTRKDSPLKKADDAILIDNSNMNRKEQLNLALDLIRKARS